MSNETSEKKYKRSPENIEKPAKKFSLSYSRDNFPMYTIWFKDFFNIHYQIFAFISENIEDYYKIFDEIFFKWLNQPKNKSKFMFQIKKEFIAIADEVILYKLMLEQRQKTEYCFIIGPFQKYLEFVADDDSPIDIDINMYPDTDPNYGLFDEQSIIQDYIEEQPIIQDNKYYLSFFQ